MDFCRSVSVSGGFPANYQSEQKLGSLDDLFSGHSVEQVDINTEWLSMFVEDCLSSSGTFLPPPTTPSNPQCTTPNAQVTTTPSSNPELKNIPHTTNNLSTHKLVVPSKARSKRKRTTQVKGTSHSCWSQEYYSVFNTDPLLLHQAYWLADSELLVPKSTSDKKHEEEDSGSGQGRRCSHCLSQRTPQWRAGPEGPKTLCNACGVRYKSGRLLPEYRPAKSPSFVSYKHSNSHKKVLEMRMCSSSSS
ncbi:hypothetical protein M8C21_011942 [Ambrosia artemisiifolia]|uniref:GATA-type domain-containing protein n=1 Tax=Ambrosia artemisiifolia TaxID=4212 RepID=A0AAD5CJA4_AMBAR|nr:hypothetical protein M8C21_011942 [Ambrosia artemisiifolia]